MIFLSDIEDELSTNIKILAEYFYGLTRYKFRALIVEYALRNNLIFPASCIQNEMTGEHFWIYLKKKKSPYNSNTKSYLAWQSQWSQSIYCWEALLQLMDCY